MSDDKKKPSLPSGQDYKPELTEGQKRSIERARIAQSSPTPNGDSPWHVWRWIILAILMILWITWGMGGSGHPDAGY